MSTPSRIVARATTLSTLERLRIEFPLESRLSTAPDEVRSAYGRLLAAWKRGQPPHPDSLDPATRVILTGLDAAVAEDIALGCYPFTTRNTGIDIHWERARAHAMCAIDALAVARLVGAATRIDTACHQCQSAIVLRVEPDGALDHDQVEKAAVVWLGNVVTGPHCSESLCRNIRFVCSACGVPGQTGHLTLPQAATVANAFFGFQRDLMRAAESTPA